jgi:small nuclear ribonucleoprotein (snRNP)-like protein
MKKHLLILTAVAAALAMAPVLGTAQHMHGSAGSSMKMDTREVLVEGVKVTFQIMANAEHRKMLKDMKMKDDIEAGTTHNVTVVLTDQATLKGITDAAVSMKVVDPKGKDQIKNLKYEGSMKSYDGYFNMPEKGKYELLVLIKTGDQKKTAGTYYELK